MNHHNVRSSKIRTTTMREYSFFIGKVVQSDDTNSRFKGRGIYSILSTIKVLDCLTGGDKSFTDFHLECGFGMKRTFINYITMCMHFGFINKERIGHKMFYHLTEKGKIFLDLFKGN